MIQNKLQFKKMVECCLLLTIMLLFVRVSANASEYKHSDKLQHKLKAQVVNFDNQGKSLIPTLLQIASNHHLPMGIERVVREAIEQPITVKLQRGTVAKLLDLCVRQLQGYSWMPQNGTILIYGIKELRQPSNLFNHVIPFFEVQNNTINQADNSLKIKLFIERERPSGGIVSSHIGSTALEDKRLTLKVRNAKVRYILNRLAALHGEVVWIARIAPDKLSQIPQGGLWALLPRDVQNPKVILDQSLK